MNGVIWSKTLKTFVPISSVPEFAKMQQERFRQSRALETYNFQLQNLTLTSFKEPHFFEFYDNDTKVTGICGDLWTLLSEKLNFTLQPIRSNVSGLGISENNTAFKEGLLGIISRSETFAIPKVETYNVRRIATDFTLPLWMNSQRLYIQREIVHDTAWMTKIFSWKIWCIILIMYLLLSICSFWSQTILARIRNIYRRSTINDHIFYNFGMICNQSYIPDVLLGRSKILEISLGLFCSILFMAFGALLFVYITKFSIIPPFHDLNSLLTDTSHKVITLKGSIGDITFQDSSLESYRQMRTAKRVVVASTIKEMFELACIEDNQEYTVLQGEDEYNSRIGQIGCHLIPTGKSLIKMWIASGIKKNFKYKKTIDLGILKLKETGLWEMLLNRWFNRKIQYTYHVKAEGIEIKQVSLVILIMCSGIIIAFIIFIIEKIVYAYRHKLS